MRKNASRPDAENPEWSSEDVREARPLMEALSSDTAEAIRRYRGQRGPQKRPTKELISLRVDRDVVAAYRSTGPGWQARASDVLKAGLRGRAPRANRVTTHGRARHRA